MTSAQIKNSFAHIGEVDASVSPSDLVLKLSADENSIRYFVLSKTHSRVIFFGDYTLHHISSPVELANAIEKVFEKDEILQLNFAEIFIGFDVKYSLIPSKLTGKVIKETQLVSHGIGTDIIFEVPQEVLLALKQLFGNAQVFHLNTSYCNLLPTCLNDSVRQIFVATGKQYFDVISFTSEKKLQLMNRYEYRAASDFIYFLLLCCDKLKIERETIELVLIGEADVQSKLYDICFRYFRNIRFIQKPESLYFSKAFELYPKHLHFNLYNLGIRTACD